MTNLSSNDVLDKVIDLLENKERPMNVNEILEEFNKNSLNSGSITRGQVLNIQTKVKSNKVKKLKLIVDEQNNYKITTNSTAEELDYIIDKQFSNILKNIKLLKSYLNEDEQKSVIDKLERKTAILEKELNN